MKQLSFLVLAMLVQLSILQAETLISYFPSANGMYGISVIDENTICVSGAGIWRTSNAGVNWTRVYEGAFVRDVHFANATTGYALVGGLSIAFQCPVLKTTNGGVNWFAVYTPQDSVFFSRIYVKNENEVFGIFPGAVINRQSQLYYSSNGGINFAMIFESHEMAFQGMVVNAGNYYLATNNFWHSPDMNNWVMRADPLSFTYGAPKYSLGRVFLGGVRWENNNFYSAITYTEDAGQNWTTFLMPDSGQCQELTFGSNGIGYAVGSIRAAAPDWLAKTTNNGDSWDTVFTNSMIDFNNVAVAGTYVFITGKQGSTGAVIRYKETLLGINQTNSPIKYSLQQNYPNPFNPKTTIQFSLAQTENVLLVVYDIQGREVTKLVDKKMNAGMHSISFNAEQLSSGTYFYKITAGDFSQTKKMILVK